MSWELLSALPPPPAPTEDQQGPWCSGVLQFSTFRVTAPSSCPSWLSIQPVATQFRGRCSGPQGIPCQRARTGWCRTGAICTNNADTQMTVYTTTDVMILLRASGSSTHTLSPTRWSVLNPRVMGPYERGSEACPWDPARTLPLAQNET